MSAAASERTHQREQAEHRIARATLGWWWRLSGRRRLGGRWGGQEIEQLVGSREDLAAQGTRRGKNPKEQPALGQRLRRAGLGAVDQRASQLAGAGACRQEHAAFAIAEAAHLLVQVRRVEQTLANALDQLGPRGRVRVRQAVLAGDPPQRGGGG